MDIRLHNTLSGQTEPFIPQNPGEVRMYTCGPTVYDYAHIGNYRTFVFQDILRRFLKLRGFRLNHVMNLTDVDDRIIANAAAAGVSIRDYTQKFVQAFFDDCKTLSIEEPEHWIRATDHIDDMVALIQKLQQKTYTYAGEGSIYYRIAKFPDYGKLSKIDVSGIQAGARVDNDRYEKESARDFALWKAPKPGEHFWETPIGPGRPGWHIECSAMAMKYLGDTFDIHGGGQDLIFPHHENEIAQSEAATGRPFANFWCENGMVNLGGEKMSKSTGILFFIEDIAARVDPEVVRFYLLSTHYRSPIEFSEERLAEAGVAYLRLRSPLTRAGAWDEAPSQGDRLPEDMAGAEAAFREAMDDDFNSAKAIGSLFDLARAVNRALDEQRLPEARAGAAEMLRLGSVLGLFWRMPKAESWEPRILGLV